MGVLKSLFASQSSDFKKLSTGAGRYAGEFDAWQPIKSYVTKEGTGRRGPVEPILAQVPLPTNAPMQNFFEDIAKRVWKAAKPTRGMDIFARKDFLGAQRRVQPGLRPVGKPRPGEPLFEREPLFPDETWQPPKGPRPGFVSPSGATDSLGKVEPNAESLKGVAKDWQLAKDLERISAYTFRGDTREPHEVMKQGGFNPPATRTDESYLKNTIYELFIGYMARRFGAPPGLCF